MIVLIITILIHIIRRIIVIIIVIINIFKIIIIIVFVILNLIFSFALARRKRLAVLTEEERQNVRHKNAEGNKNKLNCQKKKIDVWFLI